MLNDKINKRLSDPDVLLGILDNLPTSIAVKNADLQFVYSNRAHCDIIGKSEVELLGASDKDFWKPEQARKFLENDNVVLKQGIELDTEETATNDAGVSTLLLTKKSRLTNSDGQTYLLVTNTDISTLRKREDQYKALTETIPVGVVQLEEDGTIAFSNQLFNAYCSGDVSTEGRNTFISKLGKSHEGFPGVACKFETDVVVAGLGRRSVIAISSGWLNIGSAGKSAIISIIDISEMMELRRVNEEVLRLNRELADNMAKLASAQDELLKKGRMEQLGQLTATIAHELRNPLGAVRTSAFLIERKIKDKGLGIESQLERINKGVTRCDNIITQLLDFSRTTQLFCQPADLDAWLTEVVEEESKRLPEKLCLDLQLGLLGKHVPFDPSRLQRAVINMISNASEAMSDHKKLMSAEPRITISTFFEDDHAVVRVADNGPGIPADVLDRVREPLFTTKSFGTGLGIPAIEQIAVQHGGRLEIASEPGKGTVFTVWLPLTALEVEKAA